MSLPYSTTVLAPGYRETLIGMGVAPALVDEQIAIYERAQTDPVFAAETQAQLDADQAAREAQAAGFLAEVRAEVRHLHLVAPAAPAPTAAPAGLSLSPAAPAATTLPTGSMPVSTMAPAAQEVSSLPIDPNVYGSGLPDYTDPDEAAAAAANDARLESDPAFVQSEIKRTRAVIVAREAAGMETAAQRHYLERLEDLAAGGDWQESGQTPEAVAVAKKYGPHAGDQYAIVNPPIPTLGSFLGLPWWAWVAGGAVALIFGRRGGQDK